MKHSIPLALALGACTEQNHTPVERALDDGVIDAAEHAAMEDTLGDALQRLDALELLVVGELVQHAPDASSNCYGPCFDDPEWQAVLGERATQIDRLEAFVAVAEQVHREVQDGEGLSGFDPDEALDQLNALEIISFEAIDWEMDGNCYVSMCPEDDVRRARLERLIASTTEL